MKHWIEGHWYYSPELLAMCYVGSGQYEDGVVLEIDQEVRVHKLAGLFQAALEAGVLPLTKFRNKFRFKVNN